MTKNKKYQASADVPAIEALHGVARGMTGEDAVTQFIDVMLTENEQLIIGRRVLLAQMLLTGHSHAEIREKLHISPNTFVRLRRWVKKLVPNHAEVLEQFKQEQAGRSKKRGLSINPFSFGSTKKKPPVHFLLLNIADEFLEKIK